MVETKAVYISKVSNHINLNMDRYKEIFFSVEDRGGSSQGALGARAPPPPLVSEYMSIYSMLSARSILNVWANQGCTLNIIKLNIGCILNATEYRVHNKF